MKPAEQRIAIAEACGWHRALEEAQDEWNNYAWWTPADRFGQSELHRQADIPAYLNDLNAMHDAENVLTDEQTEAFAFELAKLTLQQSRAGWWDLNITELAAVIGATAAQRAEAFLRTIGKWEDDK